MTVTIMQMLNLTSPIIDKNKESSMKKVAMKYAVNLPQITVTTELWCALQTINSKGE